MQASFKTDKVWYTGPDCKAKVRIRSYPAILGSEVSTILLTSGAAFTWDFVASDDVNSGRTSTSHGH